MGFFKDYANPFGKKNPLRGVQRGAKKFWMGTPEKHKRVSTLTDQQQPIADQLWDAMQNEGAGGLYGTTADYYRDLMSDDSQTAEAMFAPEQRRFNEEIIPDLSEQFAGMGSGALSSSGFRNAAVNAGTDLSERLGSIRAQLRMQGAQGMMGLGQQALGNYSQDVVTRPGTKGFLGGFAPAAGKMTAQYLGSKM